MKVLLEHCRHDCIHMASPIWLYTDFQNTPAIEEKYKGGILIDDYVDILKKTGWYHTHIIQAPMSSQGFNAGVVSAMQKKNILGVISRYVIVLGQEC